MQQMQLSNEKFPWAVTVIEIKNEDNHNERNQIQIIEIQARQIPKVWLIQIATKMLPAYHINYLGEGNQR
jgi:hypothetical protein